MPRLTPPELKQKITAAKNIVTVGGLYFHYKHPEQQYRVLEIVIIEATCDIAVSYQALYDPELIFIRPLADFFATVTHPNGKQGSRFTLIQE